MEYLIYVGLGLGGLALFLLDKYKKETTSHLLTLYTRMEELENNGVEGVNNNPTPTQPQNTETSTTVEKELIKTEKKKFVPVNKKKEYSHEKKVEVIKCVNARLSLGEISRRTKIPKTSLRRLINDLREQSKRARQKRMDETKKLPQYYYPES